MLIESDVNLLAAELKQSTNFASTRLFNLTIYDRKWNCIVTMYKQESNVYAYIFMFIDADAFIITLSNHFFAGNCRYNEASSCSPRFDQHGLSIPNPLHLITSIASMATILHPFICSQSIFAFFFICRQITNR